jgi:uncharacterized protein (TIGR03000 family)
MLRNFSVSFVLGLLTLGVTSDANADWGSWGGSDGGYGSSGSYGGFSGGSTGGSFGSSYGCTGGSVGSHGSHGSWGGYASTGGSWGGSQGSSHGNSHGSWGGGRHHGPLARLFAHWHQKKLARRAAYASHGGSWGGSYGGSWGGSHGSTGYASAGGSTGNWGDRHIATGCDGCGGEIIEDGTIEGTTIESAPPIPTAPMESEPMPPAPEEEARRTLRKGVLVVSVPADATVVVNGEATSSTGAQRRYVSHGLKRGESYRYVVKAVTEQNGQPIEQTKVAVLRAGRVSSLDFDFNDEGVVETSLTLNVPEDAKVYLSGHETKTMGDQRRFSTTRIEEGQEWADYLVRVSVKREGRTLTKEQRVTLNGGDQAELDFDFAQTELAAVR